MELVHGTFMTGIQRRFGWLKHKGCILCEMSYNNFIIFLICRAEKERSHCLEIYSYSSSETLMAGVIKVQLLGYLRLEGVKGKRVWV